MKTPPPSFCTKCANRQKQGNLRNFILTPALICLDPLLSHGAVKKGKYCAMKIYFYFHLGCFPFLIIPCSDFPRFPSAAFRLRENIFTEKMKLENNSCPRNNWNKRISYSVPSTGVFVGGDAMIVKRLGMIFMKTVAFECRWRREKRWEIRDFFSAHKR